MLEDSKFFAGFLIKEGISLQGYHRAVPAVDRTMTDFAKYIHSEADLKHKELVDQACRFMLRIYEPLLARAKPIEDANVIVASLKLSSSSSVEGTADGPTKAHLVDAWVNDEESVLKDCWDWYSCRLCFDRRRHGVCAKCEVRPDAKLGKTRAFINMSIYSYVAGKALFSESNELLSMYAKTRSIFPERMHGAHCCGIPAQHGGFDKILAHMETFQRMTSFDARHWDGSMLSYYLSKVAWLRWQFFSERYRTMDNWYRLCNLVSDDCYSYLMCPDGTVRIKSGGQPSGRFTTLSDNSLIGEMLFIAVFLLLNRSDGNIMTDDSFYQMYISGTFALTMGDDLMFADNLPFSTQDWVDAYSEFNIDMSVADTTEFLSHDVALVRGVNVLKPRGEKMLAKLAFGSHKNAPIEFTPLQYEYCRACGVRCEVYLDSDYFILLTRYLDYLEDYVVDGTRFGATEQYSLVSPMRMSREELEDLWIQY